LDFDRNRFENGTVMRLLAGSGAVTTATLWRLALDDFKRLLDMMTPEGYCSD